MIPVTKKCTQLNLGRSLPPKAVRRNFEDTSASENETDDGGIPATAGPQAEQEDPNTKEQALSLQTSQSYEQPIILTEVAGRV